MIVKINGFTCGMMVKSRFDKLCGSSPGSVVEERILLLLETICPCLISHLLKIGLQSLGLRRDREFVILELELICQRSHHTRGRRLIYLPEMNVDILKNLS